MKVRVGRALIISGVVSILALFIATLRFSGRCMATLLLSLLKLFIFAPLFLHVLAYFPLFA